MWGIFQSIGTIDKIREKGSLKYYQKRLKKYQENEADVLIDMGVLCLEDEKFDESLQYLENARQIYLKLNEKEAEAYVINLIGDVYISTKEIDKALAEYQKSFGIYASVKSPMKNELFKKIKEVEDIKEVIELVSEDKLSVEIEKESNYDEITKIKEEPTYKTTSDTEYLEDEKYSCHVNYEVIAPKLREIMEIIKKRYKIKKYPKDEHEISHIRKSLAEAHKKGDKEKELSLLLVMGNFFMNQEKLYSAMQNFKDAFQVFHEIEDKKGEALSLLPLGIIYYILGKEDKIHDIFKKSVELFKELNDKEGESIAIEVINALYTEDICLDE